MSEDKKQYYRNAHFIAKQKKRAEDERLQSSGMFNWDGNCPILGLPIRETTTTDSHVHVRAAIRGYRERR